MRKRMSLLLVTAAILTAGERAMCEGSTIRPSEPPTVREVFVPFEDLNVILEGQPRRVLLTREEYQQLKAAAKAEAESRPELAAAILAADYQIEVQTGRAIIKGELVLEVLRPGVHALTLDLAGVGLRLATLDGANAPIGRADDGHLELFVSGVGQHGLHLELVAPLETTAATQVLNYRLPTPASTRMRMTVPGDVDVKSGAETISRQVDQAAGVTRFELTPRRGDVSLVMTLNSRLLRQERVVVARSVMVDEVTQAYERLHATFSMAVLHKAVDSFEFRVPEGFDVTYVQSPHMAKWSVEQRADGRILRVQLREQTAELVVLSLSAIRTGPTRDNWSLPRIEPLQVEGQVSVIGLLLEDRLQAHSLQTKGVIPVDTSVLTQALPASIFQAEPGAPRIRPIVAGYAPQGEFTLSAGFRKPKAEVSVTTNLLLTLGEKRQEMRGGFSLLPKEEKVFDFEFAAPAGWNVTEVTGADNKPLLLERFALAEGGTRIHVRLPQGVAPGQEYRLYFQASHQPAGWLGSWTTIQTPFPVFAALEVARESGALAVAVQDDLTARPTTIERVEPLDEHEKGQYGLGGVPTLLAFRFDQAKYQLGLAVERVKPRLTARTISSFVVSPGSLVGHYEILYDVQEAGIRELALTLPESTPDSLVIRGLANVRLKEYSSQVADGKRRWLVLLAEPGRGTVRLAVDMQQPLTDEAAQNLQLPIVQADGVSYQSGLVSVEGSAELNVGIKTDLGRADVGELVDANYQPGRRLLGVYRFVGDQSKVVVSVSRDTGYALPPVIVRRAELATLVDASGLTETAARFALRTKAQFMEVELPAGSVLWSMELDGVPAAPQREGNSLLVSLPTAAGRLVRDLRIVYETPGKGVALSGKVDLAAPKLRLPGTAKGASVDVPMADLYWRLYTPTGFDVLSTDGTVTTKAIRPVKPALSQAGRWLVDICGGVSWFYDGFGLARAREMAGRPAMLSDDVGYSRLRVPSGEGERRDYIEGGMGEDLIVQRAEEAVAPPARPATLQPPPAQVIPADGAMPQSGTITAQFGKPAQAAPVWRHGWALEGVRSLRVDLQRVGEGIDFSSLGGDPRLVVSMSHTRRSESLAWALAGLVFLIGVTRIRQPLRSRIALVLLIVIVSTLLPLITGSPMLAQILNPACYAALLLLPTYVVIAAVRWLASHLRPSAVAVNVPTTAAVMLLVIGLLQTTARAEEKQDPMIESLVERLQPPAPVKVPNDAIVVPYDPASGTGIRDAAQLLVPYDVFVKLWNQAHPDEQIEAVKPPASFALAGAAYRATLAGTEYLQVDGVLEIETYTKEMVSIPLGLEGGVLASAMLDGKPARLSIARPEQADQPRQSQSVQRAVKPTASGLLLLHVVGEGRHRLEVTVRMKLDRPGGWRVAQGRLPAAPAAALNLAVPEAQTEVRLGHVADRRSLLTTAPGEAINTALGADGVFDVRWRPKVSEADVDRSLTAESSARFDVQEDGLRLDWTVKLTFRRGEREHFSFGIPAGYVVVQVAGSNVRGWEPREVGGRRLIEVTLLKPSKGGDEVTIRLWRRGEVGSELLSAFEVPFVGVPDAALHQGTITIRRSPLLTLRASETSGVSRTDLPEMAASQSADVGPLGVRVFQSYRFSSTPFVIRLEASRTSSRVRARVQTILRIGERDRALESRAILSVEGPPLYEARIALPADLKVDRVLAPGAFEWAITQSEGGPLLSVYLAGGQRGNVSILVTGMLGEAGPVEQVALPRLSVLDVAEQEGDIVVQGDPGYRMETKDLVNCETMLLERAYGWLTEAQRSLARLALHYRRSDYGGSVRLIPRQPDVSCLTISNVRVTGRAIEETVLLDFTILEAGIRELKFVLPARLKDARVSVPQLRQKTVQPVSQEPDAPVRVTLELQDKVMGQLRVLVEHDRLLTPAIHSAPLPKVETGRTTNSYVMLESAGRSEVVVDSASEMDPLSREQQEWKWLTSVLGRAITQAYIVRQGAANPALTFHTQDRAVVETSRASIGLAETLMVVDANGAYRAVQVLRVNNTTEQYLEILMPAESALWTARVAGEPVKPVQVPGKPRNVRIPLVKTAAGDLDYEVVLKYGGRLGALGVTSSVSFPVIHTVNIEADLSQLRLYLPETYKWFRFGGTMGQAADEAELAANYVAYQTQKARQLVETLGSSDEYAKVRAVENLKVVEQQVQEFQAFNPNLANTGRVQDELRFNTLAIQGAGQQVEEVNKALERTLSVDNRGELNRYFVDQRNSRSGNVVQYLGQNFDAVPLTPAASQPAAMGHFRTDWFDANGLVTTAPQSTITWNVVTRAGEKAGAEGKDLALFQGAGNLVFNMELDQAAKGDRPQAPSVAQRGRFVASPQFQDRAQMPANVGKAAPKPADSAVSRYKAAFKEKAATGRTPGVSYGYEVGGSSGSSRRGSGVYADGAMGGMGMAGMGAGYGGMGGYGGGRGEQDGDGSRDELNLNGTLESFDYSVIAVAGVPTTQPAAVGGRGFRGAAPAGLASLDVEIPVRGQVHFFTTPRGKVEVTARALSTGFITNVEYIAGVLVIFVLAGVVFRVVASEGFLERNAGRLAAAAVVVGGVSLVVGVLPFAGAVVFAAGIVVLVARRRRRSATTVIA